MTRNLAFGFAMAMAMWIVGCAENHATPETDPPLPDQAVTERDGGSSLPDMGPDTDPPALDQAVAETDGGSPPPDMGAPETCEPDYTPNESWLGRLRIEEGSRLCAYAPDRQPWDINSLQRLLAAKSEMILVPGEYPLPTASGDEAFSVPMCVADAGGSPQPTTPGMGFSVQLRGGITDVRGVYIHSTLAVDDERLSVSFVRSEEATEYVVSPRPAREHQLGVFAARAGRLYATCSLEPTLCTQVDLGEAGSFRVDEHLWAARLGRGFAALTRVAGVVQGQRVDIDSYAQLTTVYSRHAFTRLHFVRFDTPLDEERCGALLDFDSFGGVQVAWASCDARPVGEFFETAATPVDCGD